VKKLSVYTSLTYIQDPFRPDPELHPLETDLASGPSTLGNTTRSSLMTNSVLLNVVLTDNPQRLYQKTKRRTVPCHPFHFSPGCLEASKGGGSRRSRCEGERGSGEDGNGEAEECHRIRHDKWRTTLIEGERRREAERIGWS